MNDRIESIRQGAVDFISKPFHIEELRAKIKSWIKVREATREETLLSLSTNLYHYMKGKEKPAIKLRRRLGMRPK